MHKQRRQIGHLHAQVTDARRNHQHQLRAKVVATAKVIAIEDMAVKSMARGMGRRAFRHSVGDAGMGKIRRQLTYKATGTAARWSWSIGSIRAARPVRRAVRPNLRVSQVAG